jgi:FtsZ-interacting cell division protein ZipA
MVREDIVYGLKNAMARGQSLEQSVRSFISAGYTLEEVQEAAQSLNMGVVTNIEQPRKIEQQTTGQTTPSTPSTLYSQQQKTQTENETTLTNQQQETHSSQQPEQDQQDKQVQTQQTTYQPLPQAQFNLNEKPKRRMPTLVIVLLIILLMIVGGVITMSLFGEQLLDMLFK